MKRIDLKGYITNEVGDGVNPILVLQKLNDAKGEDIIVFINSYGGDLAGGISIYNELRTYSGKVITVVDGVSASAGSVISMAGEERYAMTGANYLCHMPMSFTYGNSKDLEKSINDLKIFEEGLLDIYEESFTGSREELRELLFEDKFMSIEDVIKKGFLDGYISPEEVKSLFKSDEKDNEDETDKNVKANNNSVIVTNEKNVDVEEDKDLENTECNKEIENNKEIEHTENDKEKTISVWEKLYLKEE